MTTWDSFLYSPLAEKIRKSIASASGEFKMLEPGDRVMVGVSGGKDSTILLVLLHEIRKIWNQAIEVQGVMLDQKQPGFDAKKYISWLAERGISLTVLEEDTYTIVKEKTEPGKSYCGICSRLRRGILYNYASVHGFNKLALGHHRDDLNETLLMNLFYNGKIRTMASRYTSDDGRNIVIRPLCYVPESDLIQLASDWSIPVIPCNLCGNQENLRRRKIKKFLQNLAIEEGDHILSNLLSAQQQLLLGN